MEQLQIIWFLHIIITIICSMILLKLIEKVYKSEKNSFLIALIIIEYIILNYIIIKIITTI